MMPRTWWREEQFEVYRTVDIPTYACSWRPDPFPPDSGPAVPVVLSMVQVTTTVDR